MDAWSTSRLDRFGFGGGGEEEDIDTSRSTSGMVFTLTGGAIAWRTRKQSSVPLSSIEAEYIVVALTAKEGLWIKTMIEELDIFELKEIAVFCDNQSTIKLCNKSKDNR